MQNANILKFRARKLLGIVVLLLFFLSTLAACSSSENGGGKPSITLWYWNGSISDTLLAQVGRHFPNIDFRAEKVPSGDNDNKIRTALAGHYGVPDIVGINSSVSPYFPDEDQFIDLRSLGADDVKSNYLGWKWDLGLTPDNKMIAFPMDTGPTALFYRADIFAKAGLPSDPAAVSAQIKTWDDYLQAGVKLKQATQGKSFIFDNINTIFQQMLSQSPKTYFDSSNRYIGDQPFMKRMWDEAIKANQLGISAKVQTYTPAWNEATNNGLVTSFIGATWMDGVLEGAAPNTVGKWRIASPPGGAGNNGGSFAAITKYCQHPQEAFEIIKWLQSPQNQLFSYKELHLYPSTPAAFNDPAMFQKEPFYGGEVTTKIFSDVALHVPQAYHGPAHDTVGGAISDQLNLVEFQGKNPEAAWNDAQQETQRLLLR